MFTWFDAQGAVDFHISSGEHPCIARAAADVARDVHTVSGQRPQVKAYLPTREARRFVVGSLECADFTAYAAAYLDLSPLRGAWDQYLIDVTDDQILIAGSDRRGAMYGLYAIGGEALGVDPCHLFTDRAPARRDTLSLPAGRATSTVPTYRFRGIFLNDEDLLTEWHAGGGIRPIDYPFYHQVVAEDALDRVLETALRLRMNLIIPSSFVDIMNPAEENLIRLATGRGLLVSQHHVEPLGVSHFGYDSYCATHGIDGAPFSFVSHRDVLEAVWRAYAARWARYDGIVWQLGLRGRGDRPAWFNDPSVPETDAGRGALISDAIQTQYDIVREAVGGRPFYNSTTLWMEGSRLHAGGHLTFPADTMLVFADIGNTQMLAEDFHTLPRDAARHFGIYYHVAFWGAGPHLVQGTSLQKMHWNFRHAVDKGDTAYAILNVSNVREVIMNFDAYAAMLWDFDAFSPDAALDDFCARQFGDASLAAAYRAFYAAYPAITDDAADPVYQTFFSPDAVPEPLPFPRALLLDGVARGWGLEALRCIGGEAAADARVLAARLAVAEAGITGFEVAHAAIYDGAMATDSRFYRANLIVQCEIQLGLCRWAAGTLRAALSGDAEARHDALRGAACAMETLLLTREQAMYGPWKAWYRGDRKMDLPDALEKTRAAMAL